MRQPTCLPYTTLFRSAVLVANERADPDVLGQGPPECDLSGETAVQEWTAVRECRRVRIGEHIPDHALVVLNHTKPARSEEHTSELQSPCNLVCRYLLE